MDDYREYVFTLPDGSVRYEMIGSAKDMFAFKRMYGAVQAKPVARAEEDGSDARRRGLREELADLERRYFAEGVGDEDMPEEIEGRLMAIESELAALEKQSRRQRPAEKP